MKVFQDNDGSWILFGNNKNAWRAIESADGATTWEPLKKPLELTEEEIENLDYYTDSDDFPHEETIREYSFPGHDNTSFFTFRQTDGTRAIYDAINGTIQTMGKDSSGDDVYRAIYDDFFDLERSEEQSRRRRYLTWQEEIKLAASCLENFEDWNGK